MRRTSLTPTQARSVGSMLQRHRLLHRLSMRALERKSAVPLATIGAIERGEVLAPQPGTFQALADALGIPVTDLFTIAGWLPAGELPTLRPYLRAKYQHLDDQAIADLERYADRLTQRGGSATGPIDGEDEALD